jgi:hypothetical protein
MYADPVVLQASVPNVRAAPSGAMGVNRAFEAGQRPKPFVEDQRGAATLIQQGSATHRTDLVQEGWKALGWGFARQRPDCSFDSGDAIHSAAMFLEAAGRAELINLNLPPAKRFPNKLKEATVCGARQLAALDPDRAPDLVRQAPYSHRFFIRAAAIGLAAALEPDARLQRAAADTARRGIRAQQADGMSPERGGPDVGYQATGLVYAARYWSVCPDPQLKQELAAFVAKGADWLALRVRTDGSVDPEGSTRILAEKNRAGKIKAVPYGVVAEAFALAALVTGDGRFDMFAARILSSGAFRDHFRGQ